MNRPEKPGEQSIEAILASIRQIIADDPDRAEPLSEHRPLMPPPFDRIANGLAHGASAGSSPFTQPNFTQPKSPPSFERTAFDGPGMDRKGGAPRPPTPPANVFGSKRQSPIDDDLSDLLDEPPAGLAEPKAGSLTSGHEPKPKSGFASGPAPQSPAARVAAAASPPAPKGATFGGLGASSPSFVPPPFGGRGAVQASPPPPPPPSMPPLRKAGFYPPQPRPALPVDDEDEAGGALNGVLKRLRDIDAASASAPVQARAAADLGMRPEPARESSRARDNSTDEAKALPPSSGEPDYLKAVVALDSVVAYQTDTFAPAEILSHDGGLAQDGLADADADDERSVAEALNHAFAVTPAAAPSISEPGAASPPATEVIAPREGKLAVDVPDARNDAIATEARGGGEPIVMASPIMPAPQAPVAVVDETKPVSPLDALALGLAASAPPTRGPAPVLAEAPVLSAAETPVAPAPVQPPAPVRTLEDAVADMVRPMLQQWITDNMPRIVEKALRGEAAKLDAVKPPGT